MCDTCLFKEICKFAPDATFEHEELKRLTTKNIHCEIISIRCKHMKEMSKNLNLGNITTSF